MEKIKLTKAQQSFLRGYLESLGDSTMEMLRQENEAGFVQSVKDSDFDDGEETPRNAQMTARMLNMLGAFDDMDIHMDQAGGRHLYIAFSEKGAKMLYQVGRETIEAENSQWRQG